MDDVRAILGDLPRPLRWGVIAGFVAGVLGAVAGLVLGLLAHPATAWFAVLEVGVPAAAVGGLLGLLAGSLVTATSRLRHAG
ncbi:hypothetical protein [Aeromicrobium massiliense]|uniref:hypothetical protein n=1 Tax=Aeromicrobium massiliense TaxID=1464554 RepID=UPI000578315D|nr:hypothetical protein [Aeromicrobium massiliense]